MMREFVRGMLDRMPGLISSPWQLCEQHTVTFVKWKRLPETVAKTREKKPNNGGEREYPLAADKDDAEGRARRSDGVGGGDLREKLGLKVGIAANRQIKTG